MRFFPARPRLLAVLVTALTVLGSETGCHRQRSADQKKLRTEINRSLRAGAFEQAATLARKELETSPRDSGLWDRLLQAQFGLGDLEGAKRVLATWRVAVEKAVPKMDEYGGDIAMAEHDPAGALQDWRQALRSRPKDPRLLQKIARGEHAQGHWEAEEVAWTKLLDGGDNALARVGRAMCRRLLYQWQAAFDDFHRAQEIAPDDPEVSRAARLFQRFSKMLGEVRELDARLVLSPNDAELLTDRATLFLRAEDLELALANCRLALGVQGSAMRPRLLAGIVHAQSGQFEEAAKLGVSGNPRLESFSMEFFHTLRRLDSEISVESENADLFVHRAWELNDAGQPGLALQDAERAAKLAPASSGAEAEASYAAMKLGRADEAMAHAKRATELDPHFSTAWQYRGELEMQRREFSAAVESLSRGLAITRTALGLRKREGCYRELGLLVKAEDDHRALEDMNARGIK